MIPWEARSPEERNLLNPSFCAMLIWQATHAYRQESNRLISVEESFLVLPIVLHQATRDALPRNIRTSLAVWIQENPLIRARFGGRAQILVPYVREALLFAGLRGLLKFSGSTIDANPNHEGIIAGVVNGSSEEVISCAKRSAFVGRWFARTGGPTTVLALLGVRP